MIVKTQIRDSHYLRVCLTGQKWLLYLLSEMSKYVVRTSGEERMTRRAGASWRTGHASDTLVLQPRVRDASLLLRILASGIVGLLLCSAYNLHVSNFVFVPSLR